MNRAFNIIVVVALLLLPAVFFISCKQTNIVYNQEGKFTIPFGRSYNYSDVSVRRVVDGDTLILESGERVRLIGIDTPEMHESDKLYSDSQRSHQDIETIKKDRKSVV